MKTVSEGIKVRSSEWIGFTTNIVRGIAYALIIAGLAQMIASYATMQEFSDHIISLIWMIVGLGTLLLGGVIEYCLVRQENDRLKYLLSNTVTRSNSPVDQH